MADEYPDWRGHVIVCGLRGVGLRIVEQLSLSGVPAVVIDDDPDVRLTRILASWNVPHIAASSRTAEILTSAGLAGATAVICAHQDDLDTLGTALLTRQLREDVRVIVQLGNPAVGRALTQAGVSVLDVGPPGQCLRRRAPAAADRPVPPQRRGLPDRALRGTAHGAPQGQARAAGPGCCPAGQHAHRGR